jgi:hypothetical protein
MWKFWDERRIKGVVVRWETVGGWIVGTKVDNGISPIPHFVVAAAAALLLLISNFTVISFCNQKESFILPIL